MSSQSHSDKKIETASSEKTMQILVEDDHLRSLNVRQSLPRYIRQLWGRRYFIAAEASGKSFENQRDMFLGRAWIILSPLLQAAMYGVLFGLLLRTSRGIENFIGYLVIGIILFGFMQAGLTGGTTLIKSSQSMIAAFTFPRASLVLSAAARNFITGLAPAFVAIVVALAFQWGNPPTLTIFLLIPLYILLHLFATGIMFIVARVCAFVPDLRAIVKLLGQAWFFTSGVFFSIERYATVPLVQDLMMANPGYQFLQAIRSVTMYEDPMDVSVWLYLMAWSLGLFVFGLWFFWRAEERYGTLH